MKKKSATIVQFILITCTLICNTTILFAQSSPIFEHLNVAQSDSLINANANNPNFVILDVRTPNEYIPMHLEGAINRNYYDPNFNSLIDSLNKNKAYLVHCASGGRSGATFNMMQTLAFQEVYNMLGGMNTWNAQSYPTTSLFAPLAMLVTDSIYPEETIPVGETDTIEVILTNRANDTLSFSSVTNLAGTEFSTNFDLNQTLLGADDYQFNIIYQPIDEVSDSLSFIIESNGGNLTVFIIRTGIQLLPQISFASDSVLNFDTILVTNTESLPFVVRNAGQAELTFSSVSQINPHPDFSIEFDLNTILQPGEEYEAFVFYTPGDNVPDTTIFMISSNGGSIELIVIGTGEYLVGNNEIIINQQLVFPNPAKDRIFINNQNSFSQEYILLNTSGQIVMQGNTTGTKFIDVSQVKSGFYILSIKRHDNWLNQQIIIN